MTLEITPASIEDKPVLVQLMELYLYDFSAYDGADVDEHGRFTPYELDSYWAEADRHPFLVRVEGKWAGFVLVNRHVILEGRDWSIAEFFVMRKYRRRGIGKQVAHYIFDRFRGKWEVSQIAANTEARQFWRKVIEEYTQGKFEEVVFDEEQMKVTVQYFDNTAMPPRVNDAENEA